MMVPVIILAAVVLARWRYVRDLNTAQELHSVLLIASGLCSLGYFFNIEETRSLPTGFALLAQELLMVLIAFCLGAIGIEGRSNKKALRVWSVTTAVAAVAVLALHTAGRESRVRASEWQLTDWPSLALGWIILAVMGASGVLVLIGYVGVDNHGSRYARAATLAATAMGVIGVAWAGICGLQYARNATAFARTYRTDSTEWAAVADLTLSVSGSIAIAARVRTGLASGPHQPIRRSHPDYLYGPDRD